MRARHKKKLSFDHYFRRSAKAAQPYRTRANALKQIGFESYAAYLRSELWGRIRRLVFKRDGKLCRACGEEACQVHHRSYSARVLLGLDLGQLWSVCADCHGWAEIASDGNRRGLKAANERLDRRAQALKRSHASLAEEGLAAAFGGNA